MVQMHQPTANAENRGVRRRTHNVVTAFGSTIHRDQTHMNSHGQIIGKTRPSANPSQVDPRVRS